MDNFDDDLSSKQTDFVDSLDKASNKDSFKQKD